MQGSLGDHRFQVDRRVEGQVDRRAEGQVDRRVEGNGPRRVEGAEGQQRRNPAEADLVPKLAVEPRRAGHSGCREPVLAARGKAGTPP
jgi:hypothetical protein